MFGLSTLKAINRQAASVMADIERQKQGVKAKDFTARLKRKAKASRPVKLKAGRAVVSYQGRPVEVNG